MDPPQKGHKKEDEGILQIEILFAFRDRHFALLPFR
jgi:hypothetical protein